VYGGTPPVAVAAKELVKGAVPVSGDPDTATESRESTITVFCAVMLPMLLIAVRVYVVVAVGCTVIEPEAGT
jgi:hypothetical protein